MRPAARTIGRCCAPRPGSVQAPETAPSGQGRVVATRSGPATFHGLPSRVERSANVMAVIGRCTYAKFREIQVWTSTGREAAAIGVTIGFLAAECRTWKLAGLDESSGTPDLGCQTSDKRACP